MIFQWGPDPPLDPHLLSRPAGKSFFPFSRRWVVFFQFYLNFDRPWFCKQTVASGDPTCGSRGGLGVRTSPGKSQVIWVSLDIPTQARRKQLQIGGGTHNFFQNDRPFFLFFFFGGGGGHICANYWGAPPPPCPPIPTGLPPPGRSWTPSSPL